MLAGVDDCLAGVLREGMTEIELAADVEAWLRRQGHQGILRMRAFDGEVHYGTIAAGPTAAESGGTDTPLVGVGPNPYVAKGASLRPIGGGVPVIVDLVGSSRGYMAIRRARSRSGLCGHLRRGARRGARDHAPGGGGGRARSVTARCTSSPLELAGERREQFASAERMSFVAHGFGLEIDEPPFLARGYDDAARGGHGVRARAEVLRTRARARSASRTPTRSRPMVSSV